MAVSRRTFMKGAMAGAAGLAGATTAACSPSGKPSPERTATAPEEDLPPDVAPSALPPTPMPSLAGFPGVAIPDDALVATAVRKYANAFGIPPDSVRVTFRPLPAARGQQQVAALANDSTPLLIWTDMPLLTWSATTPGDAVGWREATTRLLADLLGIAFGAPFSLFTKRWTGQFGDARGDLQYMDLAAATINKMIIDGPLQIGQVWHKYKTADWRRVVDNWASVKAQLDDGIMPAGFAHDFAFAERIVIIANTLDMPSRQQCLLMGGEVGTPTDLVTGNFSREDLLKIAEFTVKCRILKFKGRISEWIVSAEAVARSLAMPVGHIGRFWYDGLGGRPGLEAAFRWAHSADPEAKLTYSEDLVLDTTFFVNRCS